MKEHFINTLKLKNDFEEDIFSFDRQGEGNDLVCAALKSNIDICETLTLYDLVYGEICEINMGEIVINAIADALHKNMGVKKSFNLTFNSKPNEEE